MAQVEASPHPWRAGMLPLEVLDLEVNLRRGLDEMKQRREC